MLDPQPSSTRAKAAGTVLVVDDDPVQRRLLENALVRHGYAPLVAEGGEAGLAELERKPGEISAVVLDLVMPGLGGLDVLQRMRARGDATPVIVQTSQGGMETVIAAMRAGAFDFVVKPVSPERLKTALSNALRVEAVDGLRRQTGAPVSALNLKGLIASSPAMEKAVRLARKASSSDIPILIEGESGSGKELIARAIQGSGERKGKPFVTVNCGAIPDNLVESILFGHEKGAFTGATEKHPGKFVEANGGTLFLDEIGDLPLDVQVKLLRAVQEGEVETVGGRGVQKVDIRLISATHRNLLQRVKDGLFREDLFYRLNVFPISLPPLRERKDDIPPLVTHFIARLSARERGPVTGISPQALALLTAYDWPGNIRQLENAIFRAVVLADGAVLGPDDFPQIRLEVDGFEPETVVVHAASATTALLQTQAAEDLETVENRGDFRRSDRFGTVAALDSGGNVRSLAEVELDMILLAIGHYKGQMSEVARRLGIGRTTLYRKFREYGIDPDSGRVVAKSR
ncbi:MAG: sigma-54 dependent transcriptional regulator [Mesorhizobium sp.]